MTKAVEEAIAKREAARGETKNRPTRSRTVSGSRRPAAKPKAVQAEPKTEETKPEA